MTFRKSSLECCTRKTNQKYTKSDILKLLLKIIIYSKTCLKADTFGANIFVRFRQVIIVGLWPLNWYFRTKSPVRFRQVLLSQQIWKTCAYFNILIIQIVLTIDSLFGLESQPINHVSIREKRYQNTKIYQILAEYRWLVS